jgi:hypothetical protein
MRIAIAMIPVLAAGLGLSAGTALAQPGTKQGPCDPAKVPQKLDLQVISVDQGQNKVTARDADGTTHVFQASAETTRDLKPGDRIQANLRSAPKC